MLQTALAQARSAVNDPETPNRLASYYNPDGVYAGTLFLDAEPNIRDSIEAADLYAVSTLSMKIEIGQGRSLLNATRTQDSVRRLLRGIPATLPITDLEHGDGGSTETLLRMYELHTTLRGLLGSSSNHWVFASKLCARKRLLLFPVRDTVVCKYLGGNRNLRSGDGWPGDFSVDIQVFAHLMTTPDIRSGLDWLRAELETERGLRIDEPDLKLLDAALWMTAR